MDFILLDDENDLHNIYRFLNVKSKKELSELKEIHFIELPKFKKDKPKKLRSKFEKWLHIMKFGEIYAKDPDNFPDELRDEEFIMAIREMIRASSDEVVRELLEARSKALHDEASRMKYATVKAKEEGERIGIEKGEKLGIEKGEKIGIEKGRKTRDIEIVKSLLKLGLPLQQISQATGLSLEEINRVSSE